MAMPTLRHALVLRPGAAVVHHTGLPKHMPFPRHVFALHAPRTHASRLHAFEHKVVMSLQLRMMY